MGVNLNNLSISLDQFNKASSGEFNIGQLKLSSDGERVYRTNNHKTWTIFNNTKISATESLAIKFAFCKALAKEGLSPEANAGNPEVINAKVADDDGIETLNINDLLGGK